LQASLLNGQGAIGDVEARLQAQPRRLIGAAKLYRGCAGHASIDGPAKQFRTFGVVPGEKNFSCSTHRHHECAPAESGNSGWSNTRSGGASSRSPTHLRQRVLRHIRLRDIPLQPDTKTSSPSRMVGHFLPTALATIRFRFTATLYKYLRSLFVLRDALSNARSRIHRIGFAAGHLFDFAFPAGAVVHQNN
jgi:hypothetical protein